MALGGPYVIKNIEKAKKTFRDEKAKFVAGHGKTSIAIVKLFKLLKDEFIAIQKDDTGY